MNAARTCDKIVLGSFDINASSRLEAKIKDIKSIVPKDNIKNATPWGIPVLQSYVEGL